MGTLHIWWSVALLVAQFSVSLGFFLDSLKFPTPNQIVLSTKSLLSAQCGSKADVIFVMDASERLGVPDFIKLSQLLADVAKSLNLGGDNFRLAEVIYGSEADTILSLDHTLSPTQVLSKVLSAPYQGGETCSHKGLKLASEMLATKRRAGIPAVVVLVNDGFSTEPEETRVYAAKLKDMWATSVLAVGVGDMVDSAELRSIASDYESVFTSPSVNSMATLLDQVSQKICQVSKTPAPPPSVPMQYSTKADVIYVVDSSEHVEKTAYNEILKLLSNVAKSFILGQNGLRLAEIVYGKESRKVFDLDNSLSQTDLVAKILTSPYIGGETLTHQGLQMAYDMISNKRRNGVPVYVILVTDGYSSQPDQTVSQCNKIKQIPGVSVMTVAVGDQINDAELRKLISDSQPIHRAPVISSVAALRDPIVSSIKQPQPSIPMQYATKADVIYVVDSSEHVDTPMYNEILKLLANLAKSFNLGQDGLRLAEIIYGKETRKVFDLDNTLSQSEIVSKILSSPYIGGETLAHQGLQMAYDMISSKRRNGVPVFVIHATDGYSSNPEQTRSNANKIKQIPGVTYITIAAGDRSSIMEIEKLDDNGKNIIQPFETSTVDSLLNPIVNAIKQAQPSIPMLYSTKADVIYVVDSSEHVGTPLYNEILKLLTNLAKSFNMGQDGLRLAEIVYGKETRKVFDLDNTLSQSEIVSKILSSPYIGGETLAHQGLQMAYDMISSKRRNGVPVFVIHVTDGYSSNPEQTRTNANKIKQIPGVTYMTVAAGDQINVIELQKLVDDGKNIFQANDISSVASLLNPIVNIIKQGQLQSPTLLPLQADLIFVVDASVRVDPIMFTAILKLLDNVAKSFVIGHDGLRLAQINYGDESRIIFDLDNSLNTSEISTKILTSPYFGSAAYLYKGLQTAFEMITNKRRPGTPAFVILVNDGIFSDHDQTISYANKIKQLPVVRIMCIATGLQMDVPEIMKIVTKDQNIFTVYDTDSLSALRIPVVSAIFQGQLPLPPQLSTKADIIYVVDSSEHVSTSIYNEILKLLANVAKSFNLGLGGLRLAEIIYGKESRKVFDLDNTLNPSEITTKILSSPYIGGETLAHQGLQMTYDMISSKRRSGVPVFVIHVTDGYSSNPEQTRTNVNKIKQIPRVNYMTVAAGDQIDLPELQKLVSDFQNLFRAYDPSSVGSLRNPIVNAIYQAQLPSPTQYIVKADVIYVVDASERTDKSTYSEIQKLLAKVARNFKVGQQDGLRLAEIVYGKESRKVFDLDNTLSQSELINKILTSPYIGGETLTHQGLQMAYDMISNKRRNGVPVYVILVTDGYSSQPDQTEFHCNKIKQLPGVNVFSVAIGDHIAVQVLQKLISQSQPIFQATDIGYVAPLWDPIVNHICQATKPTMTTTTPKMTATKPTMTTTTPKMTTTAPKMITTTPKMTTTTPKMTATKPTMTTSTTTATTKTTTTTTTTPTQSTPSTSTTPPTTLSSSCSTKADLVYVVDSSEHVDTSLYSEIIKLLTNITTSLNLGQEGFRLAEIVYGKASLKGLDLDNSLSTAEIINRVSTSLYVGGETLAHEGLQKAYDTISNKRRNGVPVIVLLVSDGYSSNPEQTYDTVVRLREELGVTVMVVAAGDQIDSQVLQKLASDNRFIFQAPNLYQVSSLSDHIVRTLCEVATTTSTSTTTPTTTTRTTTPSTTATLSTTTTTITTTVKPCVTKSQADIIFILDASSSIGKVNWAYQTKFAAELTQAFKIGPNDVQFGAVMFNSNVTKLFDLNKYSDKTKLYSAISSVRYPFAYGTQTYKAFQMVREEGLFTVKYGGRNLKRIAIIMTDGESDNKTKTIQEADLLKKEGVTLLSVGIGNAIRLEELQGMASDGDKNVFTADSFELLKLIQAAVVMTTCGYV